MATAQFTGLRVLVLEDEILVTWHIEEILTQLGCRAVGPASRVPAALELVRQETFDVALLDIKVNGAESFPVGHELLRRRIPFLFMTGYHASELPAAFKAVPCLEKPFDRDGLRQQLERLLP